MPDQPEVCRHCGELIEHQMVQPSITGNHQMTWRHLDGGTQLCRRVVGYGATRAEPTPVTGQPDAVLAVVQAELDQARAERDEVADQHGRTLIELAHWKTVIAAELRTERDQARAEVERLRAAEQRVRQLADQWEDEGSWAVFGGEETEGAFTELRAALDVPTTAEEEQS